MTEDSKSFRLSNDPAMPKSGDLLIGRYRIENPLGEGGFAAVFRAFDTTTGAYVAIKVLDPLMSRRDEFAKRFLLEVETISALSHPNTIRVTDKGETESGCLFLVMELLTGDSLDALIEKRGPMPPHVVRSVATQVLRSLAEAHSKNIIHRDIKPANIFYMESPDDEPYIKVLDFGIAKSLDGGNDAALTSTGQVMCSPHYVAPERVVDHETYPGSDIYSLGVAMIEMLEGKPPYQADTPIQLVMMHARLDAPVPMGAKTVNSPLGPIIRKATEKDHSQRYKSAEEMLKALKQLGTGTHTAVAPNSQKREPTAEKRESGFFARNWPFVAIFGTVLAVLLLVLSLLLGKGEETGVHAQGGAQAGAQSGTTATSGAPAVPSISDITDPQRIDELFGAPAETPFLIDSAPTGAIVQIDGSARGSTPLRLSEDAVPAPPFELVLTLADGRRVTRTIDDTDELKSLLLRFPAASASTGSANGSDTGANTSQRRPTDDSDRASDTPQPDEPTERRPTDNSDRESITPPPDEPAPSSGGSSSSSTRSTSETPSSSSSSTPPRDEPEPSRSTLPSIPDLGGGGNFGGGSGGGSYFGGGR